jgi:ribosomal protein S18 acetylase RimI-like enzyme
MIEMVSVHTAADIDAVAVLAQAIWVQHYVPIIGQAQTDYMLARFQSAPAIARQIAGGCEYYLVRHKDTAAGYFALVPKPAEHSALLSKIYIHERRRRSGIGKAIIAFVEQRCLDSGIRELWLMVNRNNTGSIAFYERMGFTITETIAQDIGNGFVLDDYRMMKPLHPAG